MTDYLAVYYWSYGDEDPDHDREFTADNDEEAIEKAKTFGRRGDSWTVYKKLGSVSHEETKRD